MPANDIVLSAAIDIQANRALRDIEQFARTAESKIAAPLGKMGRSASEFEKSLNAANARVVAFGASAGIVMGVERAFTSLLKSTIDVEKKLTDINVVLKVNQATLSEFGRSLFDIAKSTGQSFDAVSDAATEFSRQGLGVQETLKRTRDALILTRQTGLDAKEAVADLTAAMNSFAKSNLTSNELVQKLAATDTAFAVSSRDLAEAIKRVGSTAEDAGVSINNLIGLVTTAKQITGRGGEVIGNAFKTIFQRLERPETLAFLESLGVAVENFKGEALSADKILVDLAGKFDGLSSATKAHTVQLVGNVFQSNILRALLSDISKANGVYAQSTKTAAEATGEATERNKELNKTLAASFNELKVNFTQFSAIAGSSLFGPALENIFGTLNSGLNKFNSGNLFKDAFSSIGDLGKGATGEDLGENIGKNIAKGLGDFIAGPVMVGTGAVIGKLLLQMGKFAKDALKSLFEINQASQLQIQLQDNISGILARNPQLMDAILQRRTSTLQVEREILGTLREQALLQGRVSGFTSGLSAKAADSGVFGLDGTHLTASGKMGFGMVGGNAGSSGNVSNGASGAYSGSSSVAGSGVYGSIALKGVSDSYQSLIEDDAWDLHDLGTRRGAITDRQALLAKRETALRRQFSILQRQEVVDNRRLEALAMQDIDLQNLKTQNARELSVNNGDITVASAYLRSNVGGFYSSRNNYFNAVAEEQMMRSYRLQSELRNSQIRTPRQANENYRVSSIDGFGSRPEGWAQGTETLTPLPIGTGRGVSVYERPNLPFMSFSGVTKARLKNAGLAGAFLAPIVAESLADAYSSNDSSKSARVGSSLIRSGGNLLSYTASGAMLGLPGAYVGAGIGLGLGINDYYKQATTDLPELDAIAKSRSQLLSSFGNNVQGYTTADTQLKGYQIGESKLKPEDLSAISTSRLSYLSGFDSATRRQFLTANTDEERNAVLESARKRLEASRLFGSFVQESTNFAENGLGANQFQREDNLNNLSSMFLNLGTGDKNLQTALFDNPELLKKVKRLGDISSNTDSSADEIKMVMSSLLSSTGASQEDIQGIFSTITGKRRGPDLLRALGTQVAIRGANIINGKKMLRPDISSGQSFASRLENFNLLRSTATRNLVGFEGGNALSNTQALNAANLSDLAAQSDIALSRGYVSPFQTEKSIYEASESDIGKRAEIERAKSRQGFGGEIMKIGQGELTGISQDIKGKLSSSKELIKSFEEVIPAIKTIAEEVANGNYDEKTEVLRTKLDDLKNKLLAPGNQVLPATRVSIEEAFRNLSDNEQGKNFFNIQNINEAASGSKSEAWLKYLAARKAIIEQNRRSDLNAATNLGLNSFNIGYGGAIGRATSGMETQKFIMESGLGVGLARNTGVIDPISLSNQLLSNQIHSARTSGNIRKFGAQAPLGQSLGGLAQFLELRAKEENGLGGLSGYGGQLTSLSEMIKSGKGINTDTAIGLAEKMRTSVKDEFSNGKMTERTRQDLMDKLDELITNAKKAAEDTITIEEETGNKIVELQTATKDAILTLKDEQFGGKADRKYAARSIFADEYASEREAERTNRLRHPEVAGYNPLSEAGSSFSDSLRYDTQTMYRDLNRGAAETAAVFRDSFKVAFKDVIMQSKSVGDALRGIGLSIASKILDRTTDIGFNSLFGGLQGVGTAVKNYFSSSSVGSYAEGGPVIGGSGVRDDVPAMLSNGDFVLRKSAVQKYGTRFLDSINFGTTLHAADGVSVNLRNSFDYNDPRFPSAGKLNVDPSLSNFALSDENNPQNAIRMGKQGDLAQYIKDRNDYEAAKDFAMHQFRQGQRSAAYAAYTSAAIGIAGAGLSYGIGKYNTNASVRNLNNSSVGKNYQQYNNYGTAFAAAGGLIKGYADGGSVDDVPAMLMGGEYVIRGSAVKKYGLDYFNRLNNGTIAKFASGGFVGPSSQNGNEDKLNEAITKLIASNEALKDTLEKNGKSKTGDVASLAPSNAGSATPSITNQVYFTIQMSDSGNVKSTKEENDKTDDKNKSNLAKSISKELEPMVIQVLTKQFRPGGVAYEELKRQGR